MAEKHTIVVAWTEVEALWDGKPFAADVGRCPVFVDTVVPSACVWLNRGGAADVEKARAYIEGRYPNTGRVFVYPVGEKDPLARARREILS